MSRQTILLVLFCAAVLEAASDAVVRSGLRATTIVTRIALFGLGGAILLSYAYIVNAPPWDFGRLLGTYVVFFFLVAQAISWLAFRQAPGWTTLVGGALIVAGGLVMSIWSS